MKGKGKGKVPVTMCADLDKNCALVCCHNSDKPACVHFKLWGVAEGWQDAILCRVLGTGSPVGSHPSLILRTS